MTRRHYELDTSEFQIYLLYRIHIRTTGENFVGSIMYNTDFNDSITINLDSNKIIFFV